MDLPAFQPDDQRLKAGIRENDLAVSTGEPGSPSGSCRDPVSGHVQIGSAIIRKEQHARQCRDHARTQEKHAGKHVGRRSKQTVGMKRDQTDPRGQAKYARDPTRRSFFEFTLHPKPTFLRISITVGETDAGIAPLPSLVSFAEAVQ